MKTTGNVIIHHNEWGNFTDEVIILEHGLAICHLQFPGNGETEEHRKRAWLHTLSVVPEVRRQGLASRLVSICKQRTAEQGRNILSLWVKPGSWQEQWYIRLGFKPDHTFKRMDDNNIYSLRLD